MKILKIIGIALLSLLLIAVIAVSIMSPSAHMERSIVVNAPPAAVFQQLASFENFNKWSPWTKMDPEAKQIVEGPAVGVGAKMSWDGPETGKGSQWTVEYEENKRVKNAMAFEGMEGEVFAEFVLEEVPEGTKVIWSYSSDVSKTGFGNASMTKLFNTFALEGMLGKQYEEGLASLKQIVESTPTQESIEPQEPTLKDSTATVQQ
jgi:Polyketide cyclase / dehydrase and lipid transport